MRIWSIQPPEVVDIINNEGVFRCDKNKSIYGEDFKKYYAWMIEQMDKRGIKRPEGVVLPIWAWHTRNWKHKKPDFRTSLSTPGERFACIEIEIPDEDVLLSDYDNWHFVLNDSYYDDSTCEEEWETLQAKFDALPPKERESVRRKSWEKIFDLTPINTSWSKNGAYIQATFWEIKKEQVIDVKYFTSR